MTAYNKIGFLAAGVGNARGIGDYVNSLDAAGIPAVCMCNDGTVGVMDAVERIKAGSKVPHVLAYRVVNPDWKKGVEHFSVPEYHLEPAVAAKKHWQIVKPHFPPELVEVKEHIWFFPVNEVRAKRNEGDRQFNDMNAWDWMGEFCFELAQHSMKEGFKVAMPQANSGEPDPAEWKQPGMVKYLRLCEKHPDLCAIGLHEYCWNVADMASAYPHQIGRFEWLFAACDELGIARPNVLIGEWGWEKGKVPEPKKAIEHIHWAAQLYAKHPTVLGCGIWYLGQYQDDIDDKTQKLIKPVTDYTLSERAKFPDPPAVARPIKPAPPAEGIEKPPTEKRVIKKIVQRKVSPIPSDVKGVKLASFRLQDRSEFVAGKRIWFEFHYDNLRGKAIRYGSMGMAVHEWTGSEWKLHALKHSFGGPKATLKAGGGPGGGPLHDDNWQSGAEGTFALTPYVAFDSEALHKIKDLNNPGSVGQLHHMAMPVYVTIGNQLKPGGTIEKPPAPLFVEKTVEEEVEEIVEVEVGAGPLPGEIDDGDTGWQAESTEVNRQVVEWRPESGVDGLSIVISERQGDQWRPRTVLNQALNAGDRVELIFLKGGIESRKIGTPAKERARKTIPIDYRPKSAGRLLGMDVSYAQGFDVDFQKAADRGVKFCFIRAGSGRTAKDDNFEHNYAAAGRAGMFRGIYWYLYSQSEARLGQSADDRTPEAQARHFVSLLKEDAELGAILDVEDKTLSPAEVKRFVDEFQAHDPYGRPITIYTANWFWNQGRGFAGQAVSWATGHPLWVAHYTLGGKPPEKDFQVAIPKPWQNFTFHQWTHIGGPVVDHVKEGLDLNHFAGSLDDLRSWARRDAPVMPELKIIGARYVTANVLNLREGPSKDSDVIAKLKKATKVDLLETGKWSKVAFGGLIGYVYSSYLSDEQPDKVPPEKKKPVGKKIDMASYFLPPEGQDKGDIVILKNNYGQGDERQQLQREKTGQGHVSYVTKNQQFEKRIIGEKSISLVLDTSPGEGEMYKVEGQWLPRQWAEGENFIRMEMVTFFKKDGTPVPGKEPYHSRSEIQFVKHHKEWTSPGSIKLEDVVELAWIAENRVDERYWFARNLGLVGWKKYDGRESHIVELIKRGDQHDNQRESVAAV